MNNLDKLKFSKGLTILSVVECDSSTGYGEAYKLKFTNGMSLIIESTRDNSECAILNIDWIPTNE